MKYPHRLLAVHLFFAPAVVLAAPALDPNIFVKLSKRVVPSVANISTLSRAGGGRNNQLFRRFFEDFFQRPGPPGGAPQRPDSRPMPLALGSGFIIDSSGLILTNNHVVAGADEIKMNFTEDPNENPTTGEVVGRDQELDLALIRVKTKRKLVALTLGDSDALQVGEFVMAVGNPIGHGHTVTHGIISAKNRPSPDFVLGRYLQTDTPINPGNSGGPLVNLRGEVIGINNAIDARAQGIGFAIPINLVKQVLPQLKSKGSVSRGYIGVLIGDISEEIRVSLNLSPEIKGVLVTQVFPGQPAQEAGLQPYDVILEFNKRKVASRTELIQAVTAVPVGDKAPIKIYRNKKTRNYRIRVAERPTSQFGRVSPGPKEKRRRKPPVDAGMVVENINRKKARELGLPRGQTGVLVAELTFDGPAARAGLIRGDVILEVDRKRVRNSKQFYTLLKRKKSVLLRVKRLGPQGPLFHIVVLTLSNKK